MDTFLEGLRSRRLDQLADAYISQLMKDPSATIDEQVTAAIHQSVLLVARAGEAESPQAAQHLWDQASAVLETLLNRTQDGAANLQLRFQHALVLFTRGQWLVTLTELTQDEPAQAKQAQFYLESSISILNDIAQLLTQASDSPGSDTAPALNIGAAERTAFSATLRHRLGAAYLALAQTTSDDAKRRRALESAVATLEPVDFALLDSPIEAGTDLVDAHRRAGRFDHAKAVIDRLTPLAVTQPQRDLLLSEQVETLLAEGKTLDALAVLFPQLQSRSDHPPRWDYLYLKVLLIQADAMRGEPEKASRLQASALMQLHKLERQNAALWVRRAELQLSRHASSLISEEVEELQRAADILKRANKYAEAAEVYQKAADRCLEKEQKAEAFPFLHEAGRAWERAGKHSEAANVFDRLLKLYPENEAAAATSLRLILNRRREYQSTQTADQLQLLEQAVGRHLTSYPKDETAGDVYYIRGLLEKDQDRFEQAVATLKTIPTEHRYRTGALIQISRIYQEWIQPLEGASIIPVEPAVDFHASLQPELAGRFTLEQRVELVVRAAQFLLDARRSEPAKAEKILRDVLNENPPAAWQSAARKLLVLSLIEQQRFSDAELEVVRNRDLSAEKQFELVRLLNRHALNLEESDRRSVGFVAQKALVPLTRKQNELPGELRKEIKIAQTQIAAFMGTEPHIREAMSQLSELRRENPRDARLLETLAFCLMQDRRYEAAVSQWRTLMAGIRKESLMWYRAKLNLIVCLRRSGQREEARKILDLLRVLHPELGGPVLRPRFEAEAERLKD